MDATIGGLAATMRCDRSTVVVALIARALAEWEANARTLDEVWPGVAEILTRSNVAV